MGGNREGLVYRVQVFLYFCGMDFQLQAKSAGSNARAGEIRTAHGVIETPVFMPVGTVGSVKAVHRHELTDGINPQII